MLNCILMSGILLNAFHRKSPFSWSRLILYIAKWSNKLISVKLHILLPLLMLNVILLNAILIKVILLNAILLNASLLNLSLLNAILLNVILLNVVLLSFIAFYWISFCWMSFCWMLWHHFGFQKEKYYHWQTERKMTSPLTDVI